MKLFSTPFLSLGAPLLILLSVLGFLQRKGTDQFQVLPAFVIGTGLTISGHFGRLQRRSRLLKELTNIDKGPKK